MSLRWRLAVVVAVCVALAVGAVAFVAHLASRNELRDRVDASLRDRADAVTVLVRGPNVFGRGRRPGPDPTLFIPDAVVQLADRSGRITDRVEGLPELPVDEVDLDVAASGPPRRVLRDVTVDGVDYRMITQRIDGGIVQVARDVAEIDDAVRGIDRQLVAVGVMGVGLAALVGWTVARSTVRPVERLAARAEYVASTRDLEAPIEVARSDELGRLANSFNTMLGALRVSRDQQSRLVHDASHELRTPLTSLRTNVEVLRRRIDELDPQQRDRLLADLDVEASELSELVAELVDLATDADVEAEPRSEVELADLAENVAERYRRRTGRDIVVHGPGNGQPVSCVASKVERAIANLVANAVKFSPPATPVAVWVDGGQLEVRDQGSGIPSEDLAHVFARFHRSAAARDLPGSGLGLAIVQQVVQHHDGRVWARNLPDGGAGVGFELPTSVVDPSTGR